MHPLNNNKAAPIVCYVTDRRSLQVNSTERLTESLKQKIQEVSAAGADWVQLREKDLSTSEWASLARSALGVTAPTFQTRILVNDRLDIALTERAGGIHLSENGFPLSRVREFVKCRRPDKKFLIGVSCHSLKAAQIAAESGADYIVFGPIFATPTKAGFGKPQGIDGLTEVCHASSVPVIAIGGITLSNARACRKAGAAGVAAIRLFQDAGDMEKLVRDLRKLLS